MLQFISVREQASTYVNEDTGNELVSSEQGCCHKVGLGPSQLYPGLHAVNHVRDLKSDNFSLKQESGCPYNRSCFDRMP